MRIGLLEDDVDIIDIISLWLDDAGGQLQAYTTGKSFRAALPNETFDVLVLDWQLPDTTGIEELKWLRGELGCKVPVIFNTSRDDEASVVEALDNGADDYMVKPVSREVTLARINALQRRGLQTTIAEASAAYAPDSKLAGIEVYEPYEINHTQRKIYYRGEEVMLTNKEFELAAFMFRNATSLISRDDLLSYIWGKRADLNTRTVDTHISRIRTKLGLCSDADWQLASIYQRGYRLFRVAAE